MPTSGAYFWLVDDQQQLTARALSIIADNSNSLHLSAISVTEIHRLIRKGRISIRAPKGLDDWFRKGLAQHLVVCEPITLEIAHAAETLPAIHNDPADCFILPPSPIQGTYVVCRRSNVTSDHRTHGIHGTPTNCYF